MRARHEGVPGKGQNMSVSIHMIGRTRGQIRRAIVQHQVRRTQDEGRQAKAHTDTGIDPALTRYNVVIHHEPDLVDTMRRECDQVSEARQAAGGRALRSDANVMMIGTIQLSDETLERMGWRSEGGRKLPVDQQTPEARKRVTEAYKRITQSVMQQPDRYGRVRSATIHLDEGSPHVDLISDPLDPAHPDRTARHYLNGDKGTPKGQAMRAMQDHLLDHAHISKRSLEAYDLRRGDSHARRRDAAVETRKASKALDSRSDALNRLSEALEGRREALDGREAAIRAQEADIALREAQIKQEQAKIIAARDKLQQAHEAYKPLITGMRQARDDLKAAMHKGRQAIQRGIDQGAQWERQADGWLDSLNGLDNRNDKGLSL